MSVQLLVLSHHLNDGAQRAETIGREFLESDFAHIAVEVDAVVSLGVTVGRERVVRARSIVAGTLRTIRAEEDRTGITHLVGQLHIIIGVQDKVLGSIFVDQLHDIGLRVEDDDLAVLQRLAGQLLTLQLLQLLGHDNLKTLERFSDDAETLKAHYLMTLDIEETFQYGDELKRQREIAKQESEERAEREHTEKIDNQKKQAWQEGKQLAEQQAVDNLANEALASAGGQEVQQVRSQYVITVNCFEDELLKLKEAMNSLGIEFSVQELNF